MIKIDEVVIVEGKHDKIRLSSVLDATILTTDGFRIFKNKEMLDTIRKIAKQRGILIMTDSDSAGFLIRNYIAGAVPCEYIKHAYIPDILGKERRKSRPSREGKLGVEGMTEQVLLEALDKAQVKERISGSKEAKAITRLDLFSDGLMGGQNSAKRRRELKLRLNLPEHLSTKALLQVLNVLLTYEQYKELIEELD